MNLAFTIRLFCLGDKNSRWIFVSMERRKELAKPLPLTQKSICCTLLGSRKVLFYGAGRIVYAFGYVYAALLHYINQIGK